MSIYGWIHNLKIYEKHNNSNNNIKLIHIIESQLNIIFIFVLFSFLFP